MTTTECKAHVCSFVRGTNSAFAILSIQNLNFWKNMALRTTEENILKYSQKTTVILTLICAFLATNDIYCILILCQRNWKWNCLKSIGSKSWTSFRYHYRNHSPVHMMLGTIGLRRIWNAIDWGHIKLL